MVCIAAFIILCIVGIFVAFLSIFRRDIGKRYLKIFKQSLACVGKKATFQKCETGFKDNVKNSLLSKIILKNPKLLKPASVIIEVVSVLIVLVTIWSLAEATKAGLALWTLGTCNVEHPASCALSSSEVCAIEGSDPTNPIEYIGQWFSDWGEIFAAIPDKFRSWDASNFDFIGVPAPEGKSSQLDNSAQAAIDIVDPGCTVCASSFKNQLESGFLDDYALLIVPYVIKDQDGTPKFKNSELIVRYIFATHAQLDADSDVAYKIIKRIFTETNSAGVDYQTYFNYAASETKAKETLEAWLSEFGLSAEQISDIAEVAYSDDISAILEHNHNIVINDIHAKGIPTMIYDGTKHTGKFTSQ